MIPTSLKNWLRFGILTGALSVILGAFGAHALKATLSAEMLGIFETSVRYQFFHAIAIILVCLHGGLDSDARKFIWPLRFFGVGLFIFCGSLYLLVLTEIRFLGAITPLGGLSLILGWIAWAFVGNAKKKT